MKLNDNVYNVLKWVVAIVLPAVATLYITLANIWGLPLADEIGATITAVTTFLGAVLAISTKTYNAEKNAETLEEAEDE